MLCFAEVGSKISHPGGPYAYIEVAFGKHIGFISAILFIVSAIASDAAVSNALFNISSSIFPIIDTPTIRVVFLIAVFSFLTITNVTGTKQGLSLVKLITLMKTGPLILLVILGLGYMDLSNLKWDHIPGVWEVGEVSLVLFFAFLGAENALTINGEVVNPKRTIPRSIFLSIVIILILYIGIQTVAQGILGPDLANFKDSPLSQVASVIFGPIGFTLMSIGASCFNVW